MSTTSRDERDDIPVVTTEGCMLMCVLAFGLIAAATVGVVSWLVHTYHFEIRAFVMAIYHAGLITLF